MKYEIWKPVVGYEKLYSVSSLGRVRSEGRVTVVGTHIRRFKPKMLSTPAVPRYPSVCLTVNGKGKKFEVYKLVLEAFVGLRPKGKECCHNDGNKLNSHLSNLRWDTPRSNQRDREKHGVWYAVKGSKHPESKLTEEVVREMRRLWNYGKQFTEIARAYNVAPETVQGIVHGRSWKHVTCV